ncbi:aspartate aminotransferase family protein [Haliangium sp.]|uniref:aspartate aminotransferase family protein n=1 Tax=Haliangium sp. TaxID=2663208 RepID=UPI003D10EF43
MSNNVTDHETDIDHQGAPRAGGDALALAQRYLMPTYARAPITIVRGRGTTAWDDSGRSYLDFTSGLCVNVLGHCPEPLVAAVREQMERVIHTTNGVYTWPQIELAQLLVEHSVFDHVFFANSGAEANECAIKLARKWGRAKKDGAYEIVAARTGYHGRTLATLSATGHGRYRGGFEPLVPGFVLVEFDDLPAMRAAVTERTAAVLLEPMQGVNGVTLPAEDYLRGVREICDQAGALMMLDEIQTGMGRTGKLWAYEHYGVEPDVMTVAKGLGGGFPIGACLAKREASVFRHGEHASTFGGNPLACAAAAAVVRTVVEQDLAAHSARLGERLGAVLRELAGDPGTCVVDVRGRGLWYGIETEYGGALETWRRCTNEGVLVIFTGNMRVLRIAPPLTVSEEECDRFVDVFRRAVSKRK